MKVVIQFNSIDDVALFVSRADTVEGDVIVSRGKFSVDGKSLLGMLSLGLNQPLTVEVSEKEQDFLSKIKEKRE